MIHTNSEKGFSIALAMGLVLLLSLSGLYVVEYMVPFSRNIKGIENASQSFYESYSGVEDTLLDVYSGDLGENHSKPSVGVQDYAYNFVGSGTIIPTPGLGNSDFDASANWGSISQTEPVSLSVGDGMFSAGYSLDLNIRVPDYDNDGGLDSLLNYTELLLWQLSSQDNSLTARDLITLDAINKDVSLNMASQVGLELGDEAGSSPISIGTFYGANCISGPCTLKISLIQPIISPDGGILPSLEYNLVSSAPIPYQNTLIQSQGISYGFTKNLDVYVTQETTSSAFDFTVLQ